MAKKTEGNLKEKNALRSDSFPSIFSLRHFHKAGANLVWFYELDFWEE